MEAASRKSSASNSCWLLLAAGGISDAGDSTRVLLVAVGASDNSEEVVENGVRVKEDIEEGVEEGEFPYDNCTIGAAGGGTF